MKNKIASQNVCRMSENEEIDEFLNPYSIYTTAGLSYKAMRLELDKKKVTVQFSDEDDLVLCEDSEQNISDASSKRSKKLPKAKKLPKSKKNQLNDKSQMSVKEADKNNSSSVEKENLNIGWVRVTRSKTTLSNQSDTSVCENNNQINSRAEPSTTKRGRRARNARNGRNNNVTVLNAEPIEISDSPTPRVPLAVQDEPIVLSDDSDTEVSKPVCKDLELSLTEDDNYEVPVRVWWKFGKIDKFYIRKYQKFVSVFEHYSKQENVPEENILLTFKNGKIEQNDTPDSVDLLPGMIIEGGVWGNCPSTATASSSKIAEAAPDKDGIQLKIQQKGKKVPLTLTINKTQKMKVLMLKCAEQLDLSMEKLKVYFDGEAISPEDTPEDLDLEGGECMDLHVLQ